MTDLLRMPEVTTGAASAKLAEWLVAEGAAYAAGDPLATIETDKAVVDLTAESEGTLLQRLVAPGTEVPVGEPLAVVGRAGETAGADAVAATGSDGVSGSGGAGGAGAPASPRGAVNGSRAAGGAGPGAGGATTSGPAPGGPGRAPRIFTSPIARRLAKDAGIRPEDIEGTGPGGRIVRRDVERAIAQRSGGDGAAVVNGGGHPAPGEPASSATGTAAAATRAGSAFTDVPHSRMRRTIAARLTASAHDVPHFFVRASVRAAELVALRERVNATGRARVSVTDVVLKAVAFAHRQLPDVNVVWTDDAIRRFDTVDLGVAVATDGGLVTPVLRGVEHMTLGAVGEATRDLAERARSGRLRQHELEGGTATVTNLGMYGVEEFSAIINPPQSSILAVGAVRTEAVAAAGGRLEAAPVLRVTLGVDHRCIDGALAARWMAELVAALEDPLRILV